MNFKKLERSCRIESGWRLATVEEAQKNGESIKSVLQGWEWERGRLLDGWIGGSAYNFQPTVGFRSCLGFMVVVQSPTTSNPKIGSSGDEKGKDVYSKLNLSEKGKRAALFLCCEDWNYDVVCGLLNCWSQREKEIIVSLTDEMAKASESVSNLARDLQSTLMTRLPDAQFSRPSVEAMLSDIVKSLEEMVQRMPEFLELGDVYDEFLHDLHLTENLEWSQIFGFHPTPVDPTWQEIANTLWNFAVDAMAVTTVRNFALLKEKNIQGTILTQEGTAEDKALIASIFPWANQILNKKYNDYETLWGKVRDAGVKKFHEILHPQGYGTFNYDSSYGVLNTIILQAAKEGDLILVKRLINCGVQPLDTPDNKRMKTALHHAAKLENESNGIEIAKKLLEVERSEELANATDYKRRTPLHRAACCHGHAAMCELLINHKASVYGTDDKNQIPLHYALGSEQQDEKVIRVLIGSYGNTVDTKDDNGMTPLRLAVEFQSNNVRMVTWLLSLSSQPEAYFEQRKLASYLRHSSRMGYHTLVKKLRDKGANPLDIDDEGKTAYHYAVGGKDGTVARNIIEELGAAKEGLVTGDKYGRSVLHIAAFMGHKGLCEWLLSLDGIDVDACKDRDGHNALYYAVAGTHDNEEVLDALIFTSSSAQGINKVILKDSSGTTPLHIAAEKGNIKMAGKLLSKRLVPQPQKREEFVRSADVLGQTALHKAASGGHKKVVKKLLEEKAHPLTERDCDGKTALHYAAQAEKSEAAMAIAKLLLKKCNSPEEKALLLFAFAVGIGSAEECSTSNPSLKEYLAKERTSVTGEAPNLLQAAASLGNIDMTRELLSRGGNIAHIRRPEWREHLCQVKRDNVQHVLKQIDNIVEQGTDQPTLTDNLGRSAFANGLAALFLNPFVKSPITVGISGEWGMGKSSVMMQTEFNLLKTAAQLPFSDSLQKENFPGAGKLQLTAKGKAKLDNIRHSIRQLSATENSKNDSHSKISAEERNPLSDLLSNYQPKYHQVFKSLAVMDRTEMFENTENKEESRSGTRVPLEKDSIMDGQMQGSTIPSILTVRYNAWQYRNESEAWAGLAVEITKELEETMTVAEKLRTSWRYNWTTRKQSICLGVFFPCFLAILLAFWFTTIVWLVLDQVKVRNATEFKYGSLPATVIVVVWALMKSLMSVMKPISSQMVDYISLPDHSEKLGYHLKVIRDIKFLKNELGDKASWLWKIFGFMWCCITFSWDENYVPGTRIPKMTPASKLNLRMVVFVDDLDRCQENVILQILSAINLVLAACEINVILGMDKKIIQRAIIRMFGDKNKKPAQSSQDLADKYLRKIIQLPLDLPDPSPSESKFFLDGQLGTLDTRKGASGLETESQIQTAALRKWNPKFSMRTLDDWDSKRGIKETGVTKGRDNVSGTPRGGVNPHLSGKKLDRLETIESLDQDTEAKEEREHISDTTAGKGTTSHLPYKKEQKQTNQVIGKERKIDIDRESPGIKRTPQEEEQVPGDPVPNTCTYGNLVASFIKKLVASFFKKLVACLRSKHAENSEIEQQLMEMSPITYEMIIPKYSEGERDTFYFLQTHTTGDRKLPREWKRLLTYHRLAWNILSKSPPVKTLAGWQVQLIAWVFVCWQWKNLLNTIIQEWHELGALKYWIAVNDNQPREMGHEQTSGPSLKEIVQHYIDDRWPKDKNSSSVSVSDQVNLAKPKQIEEKTVQGTISSTSSSASTSASASASTSTSSCIEEDIREKEYRLKEVVRQVIKEEREQERGYWLKQKELQSRRNKKGKQKCKQVQEPDREGPKIMIKEVLQNEEVENWVKQILRNVLKEEREKENRQKGRKEASKKGKMKVEMEEEEKERKEWEKLRETLSRYNVTMDGIQAFQQFRFYCVPGHLPWPLHKSDVNFT